MPDSSLLLVMLAVLFGGMWWMSNRTRKQQQAAAAFRDNLQPGQEVMTGSGMYGTVVGVVDDVVTLETSPGVETRWFKPAIAKLVEPPVGQQDDLSGVEDDEYDEDLEGEYEDDLEGEYEDDLEGEYEDDLEGDYDDDEDIEGEYEDDEQPADAPVAASEPEEPGADSAATQTRRH